VCPKQWLQTGGCTAGRRIQKSAYQMARLKLLQHHYYRTTKSFDRSAVEPQSKKETSTTEAEEIGTSGNRDIGKQKLTADKQ
jgi:hypothetical protein